MNENDLEIAFIENLQTVGWKYLPKIQRKPETVILQDELLEALARINPNIGYDKLQEVAKQLQNLSGDSLISKNQAFCKYLREGVKVEVRQDGELRQKTVQIIDKSNISNNNFVCTNQFTVSDKETKRPDVVLFVNGLPVVVVELKDPNKGDIEDAFYQLQTYKNNISTLFETNGLLIISDGYFAKMGSLTAGFDRFLGWKQEADSSLKVMTNKMLMPEVLVDLMLNFTIFEKTRSGVVKKVGAYHQYYAVNKALNSTQKAIVEDKKAGIIWHTQGSGKSLSMVFYAAKLVQNLNNPTVVILTDRNDLDDQLFATFGNCSDILGQIPTRADSRSNLKKILTTAGGGIIFTTIQKFEEASDCLSNRHNIIVVADEAHRSQYGFEAKQNKLGQVVYGYAKYLHDALPNASFIGFTGTPIDQTLTIFGDYVDVYDINQAVQDGATVPIYYESRVLKFELNDQQKQFLDDECEKLLEGIEDELATKLKLKGLNLETIIGNPDRINKLATDIVEHFEARTKVLSGKAMIVCISRAVAVQMMKQIQQIRPSWFDSDISKGKIKLVMSDVVSSDPNYDSWKEYITDKKDRQILAERVKNPNDELEIVVVIDMWLTGFDAPSLHTLYIDKIMKTHNLMQAIARVNRVFGDKQGGLVVDYIGIATKLKSAIELYTNSGGKGEIKLDIEASLGKLEDSFVLVKNLVPLNYAKYFEISTDQKLELIRDCQEYILSRADGQKRYIELVKDLKKIISITIPQPRAIEISKDLVIFESVLAYFEKTTNSVSKNQVSFAIKQLVDQSLASGQVVDIFDQVGKATVGILSNEFLADLKQNKHKHLAVETLKKLLENEVILKSKSNFAHSQNLSEQLKSLINQYNNNFLDSTEIIEALIELANEVKAKDEQDQNSGMTAYEIAFYDALAMNQSAKLEMSSETLKELTMAIVEQVQQSTKLDWSARNDTQSSIKRDVKRILRKYGYPPNMEQLAIDRVIEQTRVSFENQ